jgi:hypothetical protein
MQDIAIFQLIVMILKPDPLKLIEKSNFTLQKWMIFGQKMKLIIITIIKHHNSKHYIHSIFINTYDNYPCLL